MDSSVGFNKKKDGLPRFLFSEAIHFSLEKDVHRLNMLRNWFILGGILIVSPMMFKLLASKSPQAREYLVNPGPDLVQIYLAAVQSVLSI